jgi:hypothetical protein
MWLLKLGVTCSWDFDAGPIAAIVVFEPVASVAEFVEIFHHIGLFIGIKRWQ